MLSYDIKLHNQNLIANKLYMTTLLPARASKTKHYQTARQIKYLHLEAEVDMLLQKITTLIERKRSASDEPSQANRASNQN